MTLFTLGYTAPSANPFFSVDIQIQVHNAPRVSGRGTTRAEDAQGTPTQSHIPRSILVYDDEMLGRTASGALGGPSGPSAALSSYAAFFCAFAFSIAACSFATFSIAAFSSAAFSFAARLRASLSSFAALVLATSFAPPPTPETLPARRFASALAASWCVDASAGVVSSREVAVNFACFVVCRFLVQGLGLGLLGFGFRV